MRLVLAEMLCILCCSAMPFFDKARGESPLESPQFCLQTAKDELCTKLDCTKTTKEPCYHGDCSDTGECICQACWEGPSCNVPGNKHAPVFIQTIYEEYISPDEPTEYPFMYVRATDKDETACGASTTHCPCSEILYSLDDEDNDAKSSPFVIDIKTGGVSVVAGTQLKPNSDHRLKAFARNGADRLMQGTVSIVVIVSDVYLRDSQQTVLLRKLQVASQSLDANDTLHITFQPSADDIGVGSLVVGSRVNCALTIEIPEAMLVEDIQVEIFTDDNNNTLAVMCPPTVTQGGEIEITDSTVPTTSYYQEEDNPFLLDTMNFSFGNVSNLNTSITASDSMITVTFSVTLKEDIALALDDRYWVSAGVEYDVDGKLWIGQIGFLVDQVPQYAPDTNITIDGPAAYYKGEVEVFNVDLHVFKTVANLAVQAIAGLEVKPYLLICELELCHTGTGFCLDVTKDLATFQVDVASQNIYESTFYFGTIVNGGAANSTDDSWISMDLVTYLRDDSLVNAESIYDLDVTADDGAKQSQGSATFTAKAARSFITPGRVLTMNVSFYDGYSELVPGESVKVRVAIAIPYSTTVTPITVRLESTTADDKFRICAVRINHIGSDISCLLQRRDDIENLIVYAPGPVATIDLGGVSNSGAESTANGVNDVIGIDFVVKSTLTDMIDNNLQRTLSATVTYAAALTLADTAVVKAIIDPALITYPTVQDSASTPESTFAFVDPNGYDEVAPGELIMLVIKHITKPDTQYRYITSALVNTTDLDILNMRVVSVGSNIACGLLVSDPLANYTTSWGGVTKDTAELDLGLVYNYGHTGTPASQEDTIEIHLAVHVDGEAIESDLSVAAALLVGATRLWVAEGNITIKTSAAKEPVVPTSSSLIVAPSYAAELIPGGESKAVYTLVIPVNTSFKYVVNFTTTDPWLQITDVNLTSVGGQLLCTEEGVLSPISSSSDTGMFALVDLGYVCNVPINTSATDEDSTLVFELAVSAMNSTDIAVGTILVLAAELDISNAAGSTQQETRELIFSVALPKSTFKLCCPESAYFMQPGEVGRCNVTMTILDDALYFILELNTPFNETASMILKNVKVQSAGINLDFAKPGVVLTSSANTTQNTQAVLDFGKIVNTGAHTVEAGNFLPSDNEIVVIIDVQMSDGDHNDNNTYHELEAGIGVGYGVVVWVSYYKLGVLRDGTERPDLWQKIQYNSTVATHYVGDKVYYQVDIGHSYNSRAEAINVKGHVFLPPYIQLDSMVPNYESYSIQPDIDQSYDNTGFYFTIQRMFFSDRVSFILNTTIRTDYPYKLTKDWKGTTPIEIIYYMSRYDENYYTEGEYFSESMDYVTYDITVPYPDIPGQNPPPVCNSPQPQGMEDGTIQDCQITVSFAPYSDAAAEHARLNGPSAWKTQARGGSFIYDRWIKVDLGRRTAITGIQTQGGSIAMADLGEFEILYSLDDTLYKAATPSDNKFFDHQKDNPADYNTIVTHNVLVNVEARYVIVNLTAYDYNGASKWYNAVRLEILGCAIDPPASDICPTVDTPLVNQAYKRGFLVDTSTNTLFVCDMVTHGRSGLRKELQPSVYAFQWKEPEMQCFRMIYDTKQWTGLDSRLRNIIGFLPDTGRLYGIMGTPQGSYAVSDKPYTSWYLIAQSVYDTVASTAGFVQSVPVPFTSQTGFTYANPDDYANSGYAIGNWKATMSGIYMGAEKVLDWNECCQPICAADGGRDNCF